MKFQGFALKSTAVLLLATGCGVQPENKSIDYKSSTQAKGPPSLEVPPDLTPVTKDTRYQIPETQGGGKASYSTYAAERKESNKGKSAEGLLAQVDKVKIERSGTQRWLVASMPTEQVWDTVKEFWQELGFVINLELPEAGIIETDWAENRAKIPDDFIRRSLGKILDSLYSTGERDKFRTRLEPGATPGTVEIYISHRGMEEVYTSQAKDETRWQPRFSNPELEVEMLRRLMVRLGTDDKQAATLLSASAAKSGDERAKIASRDGGKELQLEDRFDRAWRRVGLALDRVGFTVEDRDRSKGLYFVRYVDPDANNQKPEGFFSKLAFWRADKTVVPRTQYRIQILEDAGQTRIQVQTREGGAVEQTETGDRILGLLLNQLR